MTDLGYNRDNAHLWLDDAGVLCIDQAHQYCLEYMRYIISDDETIEAIDPSGGPFISIGDILVGKKVRGFIQANGCVRVLF